MNSRPRSPLTDDHLETLKLLQQFCPETRDYLGKCEACMINVDKEKSQNEQQLEIASRIRSTFFPGE